MLSNGYKYNKIDRWTGIHLHPVKKKT